MINDNLEEQAKALFKSWFVDNQDNDWKKIRLEEILEIGKTSIIPAQSPDTIFEHYSLPAFDNGTRPAYEKGCAIKSSKFYIQKNMFLFSKLNPRIKRIWFPNIQTEKAICSTEFIPYKPKDASLLGFCYSIVNSEAFYEYVLSLTNGSTGSHQRFHPTATLDYSLKIPDKDIIKKFESIVRPLYELIAKNRTENERLASLRDTLLPKLMSGEISVEEVSLD
ncbi:restriction endonuclease subunit S [Alistipes finegoldii]|uniref:restriction endonuclease subunit S n=2 Tax=Alistipes finegoldii TaxID=214856 RepID=UPI00242ACB55|nr:restriction endonuclease subunit S [Alistipes finegoldii]